MSETGKLRRHARTHFRVAPNNRHGAAERKHPSPSWCRKIAFGFWKKIADGAARFFSRGPRDVRDGRWSTGTRMAVAVDVTIAHRGPRPDGRGSGWSEVAPSSIDGARCRPAQRRRLRDTFHSLGNDALAAAQRARDRAPPSDGLGGGVGRRGKPRGRVAGALPFAAEHCWRDTRGARASWLGWGRT